MRNEQSCPQAPSEARDKAHAQARRQRACGVQGQSPQRSMRQSLIRRKPTRCRFNEKQHIEVKYQIKVISEYKICTAFLALSAMQIRKERSDFAEVGLAQITVGANSVRPCSEFAINSKLQGLAPSTARSKELSRAHVENIMWITQMRLQTKCWRVGTSGAPSPTSVIGQFFVLSYNGCNRGLVSSTGERCSPLQICCRNFVALYDFYSVFKLQTRCRKCFSVRSEPLIVFT